MSDWLNPFSTPNWVTAAPDAGKEFMLGEESGGSDVINRTAKSLWANQKDIGGSGIGNNIIQNGSFEFWSRGTLDLPPDNWFLQGTPTDSNRAIGEPDNYLGSYCVLLTSAGASNEGLYQILSNLKPSTIYSVMVRAKVDGGAVARIWTSAGSANLNLTTSSNSWVTLAGTFTTDATPTDIIFLVGADTAGHLVYIDKVMVVEGNVPYTFAPHISDRTPMVSWCNFVGTGTPTVNGHRNVSGITDLGTGNFTINWDIDYLFDKYIIAGMCAGGQIRDPSLTLGGATITTINNSHVGFDPSLILIMAIGI